MNRKITILFSIVALFAFSKIDAMKKKRVESKNITRHNKEEIIKKAKELFDKGILLMDGGVPGRLVFKRDYAQALTCFKKILVLPVVDQQVEDKKMSAMWETGTIYLFGGFGVSQNIKEANSSFKKLADKVLEKEKRTTIKAHEILSLYQAGTTYMERANQEKESAEQLKLEAKKYFTLFVTKAEKYKKDDKRIRPTIKIANTYLLTLQNKRERDEALKKEKFFQKEDIKEFIKSTAGPVLEGRIESKVIELCRFK